MNVSELVAAYHVTAARVSNGDPEIIEMLEALADAIDALDGYDGGEDD